MKGDFSRIRFNPARQYTAVLEQQGRVSIDSDSNEQQAIDAYLRDTANIDIIGRFGGPVDDAGFAIDVVDGQILIGPGRYYVDGILVENRNVVAYDSQPFLIDPTYTATDLLESILRGKAGTCAQLYLEVWQRLITQLDDPCLREPALGQADTTARLQTVWRVAAIIHDADSGQTATGDFTTDKEGIGIVQGETAPIAALSSCCQAMYSQAGADRSGAMGADTGQGNADCGCQPTSSAGFQGIENQLYRVEIHTSGTLETATFKWSRENASVVTQVSAVNGAVVTVAGIGPDRNLGFQVGSWVELTDDTYVFGQSPNQPGSLLQIAGIQCAGGQFLVTLSAQVTGLDPARNARMRRWDQTSFPATGTGLPLSAMPTALENGIEVTFRAGDYVSGDYWTIPARTASGQIDWPPCGGDGNFFQPASFTRIHRAPLACIHQPTESQFGNIDRNNPGNLTHLTPAASNAFLNESFQNSNFQNESSRDESFQVDDCRLLFPPLTGVATGNSAAALHVQSISWVNDDVMSVDTLLETGLFITLDQAPACPWGGGNFRVTLETPKSISVLSTYNPGPASTDPADIFLRDETVLDPFAGITVSGTQVTWLAPTGATGLQTKSAFLIFQILNQLLSANGPGWARVRIRLDGDAIFGSGSNGNLYLDGQSFGVAGTRAGDRAPCVQLTLPSGNGARASDFESWFYLTPAVRIASVIFQGIISGTETTLSQVWVGLNGALQNGAGAAAPALPITNFQALITMTAAPTADTVITLNLNGVSQGWVISIASSVVVPAGQISVSTPISVPLHIIDATDTVTLLASLTTFAGDASVSSSPLTIVGLNLIP